MNKITNINPRLAFVAPSKFVVYRTAYEKFWNSRGNLIIEAFNSVSHIFFKSKEINAIVGLGDLNGNNYAGHDISSPMLFRYDIRDKLGTLFHELGHRLITENNYFDKARESLKLNDDHQLLDLFLFDVIEKVMGKTIAAQRILYEKSFPNKNIAMSWKWALAKNKSVRQNMLIYLSSKDINKSFE